MLSFSIFIGSYASSIIHEISTPGNDFCIRKEKNGVHHACRYARRILRSEAELRHALLRLLKLCLIQIRIETACCQQLVVIALLDDIAVLHDQNQIGVSNRRKPMRSPLHPSLPVCRSECFP